MRRCLHLRILSCAMVVIFPAALFGADSNPDAILYARGAARLNGSSITRSSAIFSGDLVQTTPDSVANINATGSTVLILNDSLIEYEGNAVRLEHGGVTISTSKSMSIRAGDVRVSPSAGVFTEFDVKDVDGRVQIAARRGGLTISDRAGVTILAEGTQTARAENQQTPSDQPASDQEKENKKKKKRPAAAAAAAGGILDSPVVIGTGAAIIVGVTTWVLIQGDEPVSPAQ